jgi:hypothetical protein
MAHWARKELGCPGPENCPELRMSPSACRGCPRQADKSLDPKVEGLLYRASNLIELWEDKELGLLENSDLINWEKRWLKVVHRAITGYHKEIQNRRRKIEDKKT